MKKISKILLLLIVCLICLCGCSNGRKILDKEEIIIENQLQESEIDNVYYYNFLSDDSKPYYLLLLEASKNYENSISGRFSFDSNDFNAALNAFCLDYPIYYWWQTGMSTNYTSLMFTSTCKTEQTDFEEYINKIIETKDSILQQCMTDNNYETIKNIHDYLVSTITYDLQAENAHNIIGGLLNQRCVCDGYATCFKYLCNEAGFNCIIVEGFSINNETNGDHAWNKVELNNNWYCVDVTWDYQKQSDERKVNYNYFLITDDLLSIDHTANNEYEYPKCDDDSLFYVNMPGKCFEYFDLKEIKDFIKDCIDQGYYEFHLRFKNVEDASEAYEQLYHNKAFESIFREKSMLRNSGITYGCSYAEMAGILCFYYECS